MAFSIDDVKAALRQVIRPSDEVVIVYSGLFQFGHRFDGELTTLPDRLLDAIDDVIGPDRTILFPTHTSYFTRVRTYDPFRSRPETGAVADAFRQRPGVRRTLCPMDSYAVKGPRAQEVFARRLSTIWGDDSVMAWLEAADARICLIGVPWKYCGYHHRAEEVLQVVYRYYKTFHGTLTIDGAHPQPIQSTTYVRSLDVPPGYHTDGTTDLLRQRGHVFSATLSGVPIESARAVDVLSACVDSLTDDPYAWCVNRDAVRRWVDEGGKEREMARLSPEERYVSVRSQ